MAWDASSRERSTKWPEHRGRLRRATGLAVAVSLCATLSAVNASASQDDDWSRDFYWGVASSGYQSEGSAPDSNWKRFVDRSAGKDGVDEYRDSVDFRHRYADDIRLAAG